MSRQIVLRTAIFGLALIALTGCASKKYVNAELSGVQATAAERMDGIETQVEANQAALLGHEQSITEISKTAQEALERAVAAGKLAEGKFLYETVFSDDKIRFGFDEADLTDNGMEALDIFISDLTARNADVFVEIQGHTDSTGTEPYNFSLGQRRAESVRRHLSRNGVPLHRMSVISYGEAEPIADNSTPEGRSLNRRVTLVVLQ